MLPQEICKIEHSGTLFPAFLEPKNQFFRQGWSSLKSEKVMKFGTFGRGTGRGNGSNFMSCLSKKKRLYKQMNSKTNNPHPLKYWHQSIGHRIANDRTKRLVSSLLPQTKTLIVSSSPFPGILRTNLMTMEKIDVCHFWD